jgi:hypothetical protein
LNEKNGENIIELVAKLEHPEDIIHQEGKDGKDTRMAVKLRQGRKASLAELTLLSKTADFHDGEGDKAEKGLSAVDSDEEAEENDEDSEDNETLEDMNRESSGYLEENSFPPLTAAQLQLLAESHEDRESETKPRIDIPPSPLADPNPPKENLSTPAKSEAVETKPKKRMSLFERIK